MKPGSGLQVFGPQPTEPSSFLSLLLLVLVGEAFSPVSSSPPPQAITPSAAINPASAIPLSLVVITVTILLNFSPHERMGLRCFRPRRSHHFITSSLGRRGPLGRLQRQNPVAYQ